MWTTQQNAQKSSFSNTYYAPQDARLQENNEHEVVWCILTNCGVTLSTTKLITYEANKMDERRYNYNYLLNISI